MEFLDEALVEPLETLRCRWRDLGDLGVRVWFEEGDFERVLL